MLECPSGEAVIPRAKRADCPPLKIFQRYAFTSALKRMSVVAGYLPQGQNQSQSGASATAGENDLVTSSGECVHVALVKGAPEIVRPMVRRALMPSLYKFIVSYCFILYQHLHMYRALVYILHV